MNLLAISGSLTHGSRTVGVLELALDYAAQWDDVTPRLLDMRTEALEFCDGRRLDEYSHATRAAIQAVLDADALLVGTPMYRGSYTGALKNLFDLVPNEPMAGKVVGLIATGGSDHHFLALDHELRPLFSFFQCLTVPHTVYVQNNYFENGELVSSAKQSILKLVSATVALTRAVAGLELVRTYPAIRRKSGDA